MVSLGNRSGKVKVGKRKGNSIMAKKKKTFSSQTDAEVIRKKNIEEGKGIASKVDRKKPIAIGDEKKRQRSASSVSSTGSPVRKKRKRVSFADQLERTKLIDQSLNKIEGIPSDASPGKSILSKKLKEVKKKKKAAEDMSRDAGRRDSLTGEKVIENIESGEMNVSMEATPAQEMHENKKDKENRQREKRGTGVDKAKKFNAKKIQVTRKVKEKLMAMTRKERREFIKELQRKRKPNFELALQCKRLWEKIRSSKCTEEDRERYVHELYGLVKGKAKELIYAHDTCRVIECLTSLPKGNIRSLLFEELCPEIVRMTKSKYARFFVTKMLRHGSAIQRSTIIDAFRGHCVALMRLSWGAEVLEIAYNDYANAQQRSNIVCEFYGNEYRLFKAEGDKITTLNEIIDKDPAKKTAIMKNLEELLKDIVQKSQVKLSLTHRLLNEFLSFCNAEQKSEMIDSLKDHIPEMVHTNDGSWVALRCIWDGTAKERKMIVKNFKSLVVKTCLEEFGHRVLIGIFDAVDDTVLVNKYIVQEIANEVRTVALNRFGERVLHYLVHPRDPRYFGKGSLDIFKKGDNNANSKKDAKERYAQLFAGIAKPLLTFIVANLNELLFDSLTALLVLSVLEPKCDTDLFERIIDDEDRNACYSRIASICGEEFVPYDTERLHPIEHPQAHFVISKILQADSKFDVKLSEHLIKLGSETLASWVSCNKGCFILLHMFENGSEETKKTIAQSVPLSLLKNYSTKGAVALMKKLSAK